MTMEWQREANVIAERFKKNEIPGFLAKEFLAKDNEFVVVERGGEIYRERGPGKFAISGFVSDLTDLLLVDKSEKTFESEVKNVWLADENKIDIKFVIKFRIFHSDHFSKNLMGERKKFSLQDVWDETLSKILYKSSLPELQKKSANEFLKEDFREDVREDIESEMKRAFKEWGLILSSLSIDFKVPEGIEAEKTEAEGGEELQEEGTEVEEPTDVGKYGTSGITREEELSELEKERVEKEVEMELGKKQAQKDTEEALEAMELKDIKDKEKMLEEMERKDLEETGGKDRLKEKLEELKRAKEITEKKFYKKELSEEAFQRMMEDFEKKIIEIETKLKGKES